MVFINKFHSYIICIEADKTLAKNATTSKGPHSNYTDGGSFCQEQTYAIYT